MVAAGGASAEDQGRIFRGIDARRDHHLEFLRSLVRATREGEEAVQALVARRFKGMGCDVETLRLLPTSLSLEKEFAADEAIE